MRAQIQIFIRECRRSAINSIVGDSPDNWLVPTLYAVCVDSAQLSAKVRGHSRMRICICAGIRECMLGFVVVSAGVICISEYLL